LSFVVDSSIDPMCTSVHTSPLACSSDFQRFNKSSAFRVITACNLSQRTFRRNMWPSSAGSKNEPSDKPAWRI
jgi:hypothetical protein